VYGRATPVDEAVAPLKVASEGMAEKEAGDASGASAKSAKSVHNIVRQGFESVDIIYAPESPAGTGEAGGFAPPKRPLNIAAAMTMGLTFAMRKNSLTYCKRDPNSR
jgi:hypothetical protein